jgi:tetratricopeptide (TPR) repeat protein
MEPSEELQDQMDRFLLNRMTPEERYAFEATLRENKALQEEVRVQQNLVDAIEKLGDYRLKTQLEGVYQEVILQENQRMKPLNRQWPRWAAAASVLLLMALSLVYFGKSNSNPAALFSQYYRPERYVATRDIAADKNTAGAYFNEKKYAEALKAFQANGQNDPHAGYDRLFEGLSYLELGQYTSAEERFKRVIRENPLLKEKGQWYLALLYLKLDKTEACKVTLRELVSGASGSAAQRRAKNLLEELE